MTTLEKICADGLADTFRRRIEQRSSAENLRWTLHRYKPWARVVSHKAAAFPGFENAGLRQAVVKLKSRQSLEKVDSTGNSIPGTEQVQEKAEYIVVQRKLWEGREGDWMVWGTTEESDWKQAIRNA